MLLARIHDPQISNQINATDPTESSLFVDFIKIAKLDWISYCYYSKSVNQKVTGQKWYGQNGTNKMVRTKCYGQNSTDHRCKKSLTPRIKYVKKTRFYEKIKNVKNVE